ncbi:MAG: hypothetical protein J5898_02105 [Lachnospiraceae bacterium]|nr:hypothetical protein [Lachnospiraceae bacterium]
MNNRKGKIWIWCILILGLILFFAVRKMREIPGADLNGRQEAGYEMTQQSPKESAGETAAAPESVEETRETGGAQASESAEETRETGKTQVSEGSEETKESDGTQELNKEIQIVSESKEQIEESDLKFRNKKLLNQHYEKHGIEMGFESAAEYEAAAAAVVKHPDVLHKTEAEDGDDVYYVESTNEFVVVSKDGYIRTYFLPSSGKKYYDRQ